MNLSRAARRRKTMGPEEKRGPRLKTAAAEEYVGLPKAHHMTWVRGERKSRRTTAAPRDPREDVLQRPAKDHKGRPDQAPVGSGPKKRIGGQALQQNVLGVPLRNGR